MDLASSSSHTKPYSGFEQVFIAGRWQTGRSDRPNRDVNPWTGETLTEIPQATRDDLHEAYTAAKESGARELVGGQPRRWVLPPHVFADVTNDNPLAREEIFGPVAPLIRARDEEHALHLANDTPYGLSSAVFTGDLARGLRFAQRVEAGMTHVNDQPVNDLPSVRSAARRTRASAGSTGAGRSTPSRRITGSRCSTYHAGTAPTRGSCRVPGVEGSHGSTTRPRKSAAAPSVRAVPC